MIFTDAAGQNAVFQLEELAFLMGCEPSFIHKLEKTKRFSIIITYWYHGSEAKIENQNKIKMVVAE